MKYTNTSGTVLEIDPGMEKHQFTMEINAKSFSILSEGIYSNKIRAVIRELYTNALDSHNEAGTTKLVDVHLPTSQEPFFYVQDFGVGLDQDDIINVYTKFFASTKDQTNRYTGSLGVGAKVFYAYHTKSCTIEAIKNGKKIIYNCFLENGIPSYTKMGEFDTKECNGVKIQLPVQNRDFNSFRSEAKEVFKWCSKKPNFIGEQLNIEEPVKLFEGNGWYYSKNEECTLVMGNIGYPIEVGESGLEKYRDYIGSGLVIEARLGQVEFNSSREGLSYTPKTVAFLQMKFNQIKTELASKIEDKIKNSKNLYEASVSANTIYKTLPYSIRNIIGFDLKYNNNKIETTKEIKIEGVSFIKYEYLSYRPRKRDWVTRINYDDHQLVEVDIKRGQHQKAKEFCENNKKDVYIISFDEENHKDCKKKFFETLACDESNLIKASTIPHTPSKSKASDKNPLTEVMIYTRDYRASKSWKDTSIDINDPGVYVIRNGYQFFDEINGENRSSKNIKDYFYKLKEVDISEVDVYAIKKKDEQQFIDAGWVNLADYIKESIKKKRKEIIENFSYISLNIGNYSQIIENIRYINDFKHILDKKDKIMKYGGYCYMSDFIEKSIGGDVQKEISVIQKERQKEVEEFKKELDKIKRDYPLLNCHYGYLDKKELVYYYEGKKNEV